MISDNIIYFCDSYYLMIDYNETLEEIIKEFIDKETNELVENIINEMNMILKSKDEKTLKYILEKSCVITTTKENLVDMINEIYDEFKRIIDK